jgi:hypothetical protein
MHRMMNQVCLHILALLLASVIVGTTLSEPWYNNQHYWNRLTYHKARKKLSWRLRTWFTSWLGQSADQYQEWLHKSNTLSYRQARYRRGYRSIPLRLPRISFRFKQRKR